MPDPSPYLPFTLRFEEAGISYVVGGGLAAILYGEPRLTLDLDVLVDLRVKQIDRLLEVFPAEEFYVPPADVIRMEIARGHRGHMNLYYFLTGIRADIYLRSPDPLDAWALANPNRMEVAGGSMAVAPPEAVIIRKLEYFREGGSEKHVRDVQTMLAVQGSLQHRELMEQWIVERRLSKEWSIIVGNTD
jgi:hypothetical protein